MSFYGNGLTIEDDGLAVYGENMARLLRPTGKTRLSGTARETRRALSMLSVRHDQLSKIYGGAKSVPTAAEWLLDNFFLARGEAQKALGEFRLGAKLPCVKGRAVLFELCLSLVRAGDGRLTETRAREFFKGCQSVYVLNEREIYLLPAMLRAALLHETSSLYGEGVLTSEASLAAERLFSSFRILSTLDLSELLEDIDRVEQLYKADPAGIYSEMSEKTRAHYKRRTAQLAKKLRVNELRVAERVLYMSRSAFDERERHIGHFLFIKPLGEKEKRPSGAIYTFSISFLTLITSALAAFLLTWLPAFFLLLVPVFELVKLMADALLLRFLPPAHVPRMELEDGVPAAGRTLCVISALLTSAGGASTLARRLEEYYLANSRAGANLLFGVLGDLPDFSEKSAHGDEEIISAIKSEIDKLNAKYGGGFFLFLRERVFNERDGKYMAHERKRGAIVELARLLDGQASAANCLTGCALSLRGVRYILTLDEDTRLTPESASMLIGAMLHPLNHAVVDKKLRRVVRGHAVIQPRMATTLGSVEKSDFSRVFAGQGGSDPYGCDCSELYMDAFSSGGFAGKGIIDVRAFRECLENAVPENTVLSHDALEGAFLRGALMSDVELLDSFPSDLLSYFKRMHRWTRGDWQNTPWLGARGKALPLIERFRLFDSVRRSLFPPACLAAFLTAFFLPSRAALFVALTALLAFCARLVQAVYRNLFQDVASARLRFRSHILRGANAVFMQTLIRLLLLPYESYVCLSAAGTALWRMLVSHRNMLNWTPASAFDGVKSRALKYFAMMWPSCALGLVLLIFAPSILGETVGLIWILSPAAAYSLSQPKKKPSSKLSEEDRRYLLACASKIWSFFEEFCTASDHFLPPDNYQERPPVGLAHRSSPTNIGLCLISCLAALDLGVARRECALGILENVLATMRRLPKWNGHLYNWYDTQTLKPLHPAYVSTVDSGNLAVCLMIAREGLLELGLEKLADYCQELLEPMDFRLLYDSRRRLFSIGMDTDKGALSKSYYDLMASEARSVSFIAIARGQVPRRHWSALSRAQVAYRNRRGCVSWTGTMFEYLMPRLFFKSVRGSLIYEADRFCVDVQKRRVKKAKLPWGISESAYYSLDPGLSYRYKAHGVAALALKRGMDSEIVVSPYSSFIALPAGAGSAVANLRHLESIYPQGKYGFWDAYDFSNNRSDGSRGEIVRCAMAHHLGMSLIAIGNCLTNDLMPRRLMRVPSLSAFSCLLEEKLPLRGGVLHRREGKPPETPPRAAGIFWERRGERASWTAPTLCALSNGSYNIMLTDTGVSRARWGTLSPYYTPSDSPSNTHGLDLSLEHEGRLFSLLPSPDLGEEVKTSWEFTLYSAKFSTEYKDFRAQCTVSVSGETNGEKRRICVSPSEKLQKSARLICSFVPMLAPYNDYINHPAFYSLGLDAYELNGCYVIHRSRRGNIPECYLALASDAPMEFSARRDLIPGRGELTADCAEKLPGKLGALCAPFVCAALPLRLGAGAENAVTIAIGVGSNEREAFDAAHRILTEPNCQAGDFPAAYAKSLGMTETQVSAALDTLRALEFPQTRRSSPPTSELWRFGISGEQPIIAREIRGEEDLDAARAEMLAHNLLSALARPYDLVLITDEGGDYMRPLAATLENLRHSVGSGSAHIRILDSSQGAQLVLERSCSAAPSEQDGANVKYVMSTAQAPLSTEIPEFHWNKDNSFEFYVNSSLPPRAWSNMLTNGRFGFLATDCGTGHLWFENAREYHINRWQNDVFTCDGTEKLLISGRSAFCAPGESAKVTYGFGFAKWERALEGASIETLAFIPEDVNARVLIVSWEGAAQEISWFTDLVLGGDAFRGRNLQVEISDGVITVTSPESAFAEHPFRVCASAQFSEPVTQREAWLRGGEDNPERAADCLGLRFRAESPFILVTGCDEPETLLELLDAEIARASARDTAELWKQKFSRVRVETSIPALDRLINGWLPYQALACRLMGRCSMYQSGGAIGFRDQLQDAVNLILLDPELAKKQVRLCCAAQYEQGDVMHWWHGLPGSSRGVRTRCSDDLIWLPWALCEYIEKTGDADFCWEKTAWLVSEPLKAGERDRYETAVPSENTDTVLLHCKRALECVIERGVGAHGLLLIGGGDWNDGFDKVGEYGHGESVWLSWFFSDVARRFTDLLRRLSLNDEAFAIERAAQELGKSADAAWDGSWYLRGWFDDGTPLGSASQDACRIDSIAQSFAALNPYAAPERVSEALTSAVEQLFDRENKIVKLFTPPFVSASPSPGYIESYGAGFRENGGQYTHASVWLALALLEQNRPDEAFEIIEALLPSERELCVYQAEPYALAADVSSNPDCTGLAGWSWYTGAAGWFWRVLTENLLGLKLKDGKLSVSPKLPEALSDAPITLTVDGKTVWQQGDKGKNQGKN
ncbi:MAG: hypothetical protein LBM18_03525 [Oscillospiraceae bacterium]|jgi:cyclic beta-1,2-glucan synthetase|nr:hypothetical protein [Oscillospiraceae bacterium]